MKDYSNLDEVIVKTQEELDEIPVDFRGRIYIEGGTPFARIYISKKYPIRVVARGNSSVVARENSSVVAWGNSSVEARENSSVVAWGNSSVVARENSSVEARGNSSVEARENSSVVAWGNSSVVARGNSSVVARENSSVEARGNSSVVAWGNSSVVADQNVQVVDYLQGAKIRIAGNARIVTMPKNIFEFMDFYNIRHTKTTATFYKAVHKTAEGVYFSEYNHKFDYAVGKTYIEQCSANTSELCGVGLHIATLTWALDFGHEWKDLAILEVEVKIDEIVMPQGTNGKFRTSELTVIREMPLAECGLYGKILAKRNQNA